MPKEVKYDENGQVIETTVKETETSKEDLKGEPKGKKPEGEPKVKTFTEEEVNKQIQSAASKAKNEILAAIGIKNVEEGKEALLNAGYKTQYEEEVAKREEVEQKYSSLSEQHTARENELLVKKLGIAEEHAEAFIQLVDADTSDLPREEKGANVKKTLIAMVGGGVKVGTEKTGSTKNKDEAHNEAVRRAMGLK